MNEIYFSIEKFTYIKKTSENNGFDINEKIGFLPKLLKRRLNSYDRKVVYLINEAFDESVETIFFSSRYGEFQRLKELISEYQEYNEVSPSAFSASVHNFPVGFYSMLKKIDIPTNSLSAGENSFSEGLLCALLNDKNIITFCANDKEDYVSFKINKNKVEDSNKNFKLIKSSNNKSSINEINEFIDFILNDEKEILFNSFKLEATR